MASEAHPLHIVMLPLMCPGHFIPMLDMARLLARRQVKITIVTVPVIALKFAPLTNRAKGSGLPLYLRTLRFPSSEVGLPEGCESLDLVPSKELLMTFFTAVSLLQDPFERLLEELKPRPSCIISDRYIVWAAESALKLGLPRIIFDGMSCFTTLSQHYLYATRAHEGLDDWDTLVLPGLPDRIEMFRAHLPTPFTNLSTYEQTSFCDKLKEASDKAYGVVINTFDELETEYVEGLKKVMDDRVWCVGPLSLSNEEVSDKAERGDKAAIDGSRCLEWLDGKEPGSVLYVCLGTLSTLPAAQLAELGLGLEASRRPFVWVLRGGDKAKEIMTWIDEDGFEDRNRDAGLIIRGWAPQVLILSHPAVGAFLTHCGWNSTLEGICAGIPLITWPMFADQFFNEKLVKELLKIGVSVGNQHVVSVNEDDKIGVAVKRERVAEAVEKAMDEGVEGGERMERAKLLGEKAKKAMTEGGSSYMNMSSLIEEVIRLASHTN